jgi:hypothetical protein
VRGFARTFGVAAPTADSASGGSVRHFPPLPVPITAPVKSSPKIDFYQCQIESHEPREQKTLAARFFCSILFFNRERFADPASL